MFAKKSFIKVLAILICVVIVALSLSAIALACHNCNDADNCPICSVIILASRIFKLALLSIFYLMVALICSIANGIKKSYTKFNSPIFLKVRMNN